MLAFSITCGYVLTHTHTQKRGKLGVKGTQRGASYALTAIRKVCSVILGRLYLPFPEGIVLFPISMSHGLGLS